MRKYDTYTPEIEYKTQESLTEQQEDKSPRPQNTKKRVSSRRNASKSVMPSKQAANPGSRSAGSRGFFHKIHAIFTGPSARILSGLFLGFLAIYIAVSFFAYLSTCIEDQSRLASSPIGYASGIENPAGEGGARLAELLINEGFGFGSFVIILWLGALSMKALTSRPKFRVLDFTIKCLVALIAVSLIVGLATYTAHSSVNWGGYHGTYVNELVIHFIGGIGALLLSLFMIALFVTICMRDVVKWILKLRRRRLEKRRLETEKAEAARAKEEEILRMKMQEEADDLKAGEATSFESSENTDSVLSGLSSDEEPVAFSGEDSIYALPDEIGSPEDVNGEGINNPLQTPAYTVSDQENENDGSASDCGAENPEALNPDAANHDIMTEYEAETAINVKPMVVNVNQIDQSGKRHYRSDIERLEAQGYAFPPATLLWEGKEKISVDADEQIENKRKIEKTLSDFGIGIQNIEATVGPTVTLYEIIPDTGVKIARIRSLSDDIARSLSARSGVRIIAPIPGKGTVGIEVANKDAQTVSMRTVINSKRYRESKHHLPVALGSTISNEVYIADLAKMPHLLVAGATGQGKSVGLNAIIASILYCKAPHEVKFVMIDPKQVEFSLYNMLRNHYMAALPGEEEEPVITDMQKVEETLNSLCIEMDNRYTLLKNAQTRNLEEYNAKIREGKLDPSKGHHFLPYIVVIVDEFGDLIMVSGKNVEMPIARLAQKARAVGMHVIIATQRPSTNVITGIIKANFPARISFKVSSGVDSKTILDTTGAQQLIGRGDMLIFNNSEMVRVQCAFIDTPEVERICEYISHQPYPPGIYELPEPPRDGGDGSFDAPGGNAPQDRDPLFFEVAKAVVTSGTASTSAVQRHYEIGYNRAGRIMDQLERAGIVGPAQGGKPRVVRIDPSELQDILNNLM